MEQRVVNANGLRFATLEAGTGPLVLLLHGFPDTAHTWDRAIAAFAAAGFRAVAPFMRGYHPTEIPPGGVYDTDTLAADVVALIEAQTEEPAIVIGHDWGASAAYGAATIAPGRVRLLVTFAIPHPRSIKPTPRLAWAMRHLVTLRGRGAAKRLARDDFAMVDELWQRWSVGWQVPPSETAHVKAAFRVSGSLDAALGYYRALTLRTPDCHRGPVTVPTIAFAGEHDLISPRAFEKARKLMAASYEVVQVPGGHFMHRQHADHVIPELVRVVTDHARVR